MCISSSRGAADRGSQENLTAMLSKEQRQRCWPPHLRHRSLPSRPAANAGLLSTQQVAVALSSQGDCHCDDEKDINVLVTRKSDGVPLNIIKQQDGTAIRIIDNATVNQGQRSIE